MALHFPWAAWVLLLPTHPASACLVSMQGRANLSVRALREGLSPPFILQPHCHGGSRCLPDVNYWRQSVRVTALSADRLGRVGCAWASPSLIFYFPTLADFPLPPAPSPVGMFEHLLALQVWVCHCRCGCGTQDFTVDCGWEKG